MGGRLIGNTLASVVATDPGGETHSLATGKTTVLLVFRSDCVYCEQASLLWRDWTHGEDPRPGAVALTTEPLEAAQAYVTGQGFDAEVWSVDVDHPGGIDHALVGWVPWVL